MNKNTMPIYIFIVLLTIGTIDSVCGGSEDWDKEIRDRQLNRKRDRQLNRIERKIDGAGIKARNEQIRKQNQQIRNNHNNSIVSMHPDYKEIAYGQEFPLWISSMPPKELIRAKDIVYRGTADEIILLLTGYKGNYIPPILKRKRQIANSILGKKPPVTPKGVAKKDFSTFTMGGIENILRRTGELAARNASPEYQAAQRKARKALGMVNKKEILLLIEEENLHYSTIENVHPDYQVIVNDPKFYEFINNLPEKERKLCNAIVDHGSAAEVNALLSAYKQSKSTYIENTEITSDNLKTHAVGEVVKLNNPSDDCVVFYKDSSLKNITILFTNGVRAKIVDVKDSNIYKVKVGENIGWVSGSVIK